MSLCRFTAALGHGLAAGAVGTAAMTAAQTLDMQLTGREASDAPVKAVREVLGIEPVDEAAEKRLGMLVHWSYGKGWGVVRGMLAAAGLRGPAGTLVHLGLVWGSALVLLPSLDLAPPPGEWGKEELAKDLGFHVLYAVVTGLAVDALMDD